MLLTQGDHEGAQAAFQQAAQPASANRRRDLDAAAAIHGQVDAPNHQDS